jgi:hypothetical protein
MSHAGRWRVDADLVIRVLGLLEVHAGTEADRDARAVMLHQATAEPVARSNDHASLDRRSHA